MMNSNPIFSGTSVIDITPPLHVGLLTSSVKGTYAPFEFVRVPLKARVLFLKSRSEKVVIVSLDLLALTDTSVGGWDQFKQDIADELIPDKIIITCTHTHNAPESVGLSNLYSTVAYQHWLAILKADLKKAIADAEQNLQSCNFLIGCDVLQGFTLQRRIESDNGIIMSDSIQPISAEIASREPVDRRIRCLRLENENQQCIATLVQGVCHPVNEMCMPHISSDFPGEMCRKMELSSDSGMPLFLNGAAGDTNPLTVSMGPEYSEKQGHAIAHLVQHIKCEPIGQPSLSSVNSKIQLGIRKMSGVTNQLDAIARFTVIAIGDIAIVFLPGEPFISIAMEIEKRSPFRQTIIAGYGENNIGYIPTERAFVLGGYEIGPGKWSFLPSGTDRLICDEAVRLLKDLETNLLNRK